MKQEWLSILFWGNGGLKRGGGKKKGANKERKVREKREGGRKYGENKEKYGDCLYKIQCRGRGVPPFAYL